MRDLGSNWPKMNNVAGRFCSRVGPLQKGLTGPVRSVLIPRAVLASREVCVGVKAWFTFVRKTSQGQNCRE